MKRILICVVAVVIACSMLSACNRSGNSDGGKSREITDMSGRTVIIPETVNKVFVDWAQGTLHLMTLGALDKDIAVRTAFGEGDTFAWARTIYPNFSSLNLDDAPFSNLESLLAYEPDVVFTIEQGNFTAEEYAKVGIPTVVVKFEDYETFRESMSIIGNVLGGDYAKKAEKFNKFFTDNITLVTERLADVNEADKKVIHYVDGGDDALKTVGRDQVEATWVKTAGGKYSAEEFTGRGIVLTEEKFLQLNPDIILVGSQKQATAMKWLLNEPSLQNLDAVKNQHVYRIPQGIFPWCKMGPEASMQMVWAAKFLYPDRFDDINIATLAKGFYRDFLGADVSDEQLEKILAGKLSPDGE